MTRLPHIEPGTAGASTKNCESPRRPETRSVGRVSGMGRAAKNYPRELKDRAMVMVREVRPDYPSEYAAIEAVAAKLAIGTPETLRKWIRQAEIDSGARQGVTSEESAEVRKLRAENRELRRGERDTEGSLDFLRGGTRPPASVIVRFIDEKKDRFGVEPLHVRPARQLGLRIRPVELLRRPSPAAVAARCPGRVSHGAHPRLYDENYSCYGARKVWLALRQDDHATWPAAPSSGSCASWACVARPGARSSARRSLTRPRPAPKTPVGRNFAPPRTCCGSLISRIYRRWPVVYVAFVIDAYARRILGWKASSSMTAELVLAAVDQAIFTRKRDEFNSFEGLIHHNDAGSQYTSLRFTERLAGDGITPSIGIVGDAHDNALAESINGLYKTELIKPRRPWRGVDHVSAATADYIDWFDTVVSTSTAEICRRRNSRRFTIALLDQKE